MEKTYYYYTLQELYLVPEKYYNVPSSWDYFYHPIQDETYGLKILTELNGDDDTKYLVQPLMNRWSNSQIALVVVGKELKFYNEGTQVVNLSDSNKAMSKIWSKLNMILPKYKEEYKRLKAILDKDSFKTSSKSSNKATVKQNDTPTSYGDYKADNYMSNYSETSNENENSVETNEIETYDAVVSRFRNLPQEIINEMKEFEIWI